MAPVNDVLSMEMLLCFILQYLEPGDIFRCRGVCSYFNQVIRTSSMVKRACYHLPLASSQDPSGLLTEAENVMENGGYTLNPTLQKRFPQFFSIAKDNKGLWGRWEFSTNAIGTRAWKAVVSRKASWRNMLVSQPPITRLDVLHVNPGAWPWPNRGSYLYEHKVYDVPGGLTMSVLYRFVLDHLSRPGTSFALDWTGAFEGSRKTYDIRMLTAYRTWTHGFQTSIDRRVRIYPPPHPRSGGHVDLSGASVTLLLSQGQPDHQTRELEDTAWYEKWSLKKAPRQIKQRMASKPLQSGRGRRDHGHV